MAAELAAGILVPVAVDAIKGLCKKIIEKYKERKQSDEVVDQKESEKIKQELEKDLERLSSKVSLYGGIMLCAADKSDQVQPVQSWLQQLKEALYDAEDLLDEYATDIAIQEMEKGAATDIAKEEGGVEERVDDAAAVPTERVKRGLKAKVCGKFRSLFTCTKNNTHIYDFSKKVKDIISKLDDLKETRAGLGLEIKPNGNAINQEWRETTPTPDCYFPVVGREDDKSSVKNAMNPYLVEGIDGSSSSTIQEKPTVSRLLSIGTESARENILESLRSNDNKNDNRPLTLSILPIVGIGGLGKTTLARMIFNDKQIKENYDLRVWICVSENFDKKIILKKIIDSINPSNTITSLQALEQELAKLVQGKHLFLVLDDIWCDYIGLWESFLNPLKAACTDARGINILITTRLTKIAKVIPECMEPFVLQGLKEEDMRQLLMFHAFHNCNTVDDNTRHMLETIAKDIVKRLKGSPLAAKTIGRLLASKHTIEHWTKIVKSDLHTLEQDEDDIIPILRLSYQHLPGYLKQCLIYFSLFPKDTKISKTLIVHMWMANNCIRDIANRDVEDVGNEYFDFLVERSFVESNHEEGKNEYSMHDLIHDLIQSVSKYDCYWQYNNRNEREIKIPSSMRHAIFDSSVSHFPNYQKLRTLFIDTDCVDLAELMNIRSMSCLRFLHIKRRCPQELLECICNLKHLRVLYVMKKETIGFPESLGRLQNIQVLVTESHHLRGTLRLDFLDRLPQTVTRLVNLRHLRCKPENIFHVHGIGMLSLLQNLPLFCVKKKEGFHISQLKDMNMLHGKLEIRNLCLVNSKEEAEQAFLNKKVQLRELKMDWSIYHNEDDTKDDREKAIPEEVLEGLKPCSELKRISILNYVGGRLPSWMTASCLSSLESITLRDCPEVKSLPVSIGKLRLLKKLNVKNMPFLKYMKWQGDEGSLFPSLEEVYLENLPEWVGWWIETEDEEEGEQLEYRNHRRETSVLPRLKNVTLKSCPKATRFAARAPMLEMLELSHVPSSAHDELLGDDSLPHLRYLIIVGIPDLTSLHLPEKLHALESLETLYIDSCPNLTSCLLPPAPALKSLKIIDCQRISCLKWQPQHPHLPDRDSPFPALEELYLNDLPEWVGWWAEAENEEEEYQKRTITLSRLKELRIMNCPKATRFAVRTPMVEELMLQDVPVSLLVDVQVVSSLETPSVNMHHRQSQMGNILLHLKSLWLKKIPDLTSLRLSATIPSLKELKFCSFPNLTSLQLPATIPSLEILDISYCPNLTSCLLPPAPALKSLEIIDCQRISCLKWQPQHPHLPDRDSPFPALEELCLIDLPEWVGWWAEAENEEEEYQKRTSTLSRLKILEILRCPKATCFAVRAPALEKLDLYDVPVSLLVDVQVVSSLETPSVNTHHRQSQMGNILLHLKSLWLKKIPDLTSLNITATVLSLQYLKIDSCPNLTSCLLPPAPVALESLKISKCARISSILLSSPVLSIKNMYVKSCPELVFIGSTANHQEPSPVAPKGSEISSALPSSHVLSIEYLWITNCPQLGMAPHTTSSLPISIRPTSLMIYECHSKQLLRLLRGFDGVNLEELLIVNCNDMERHDEDYDGKHGGLSTALLQLTSLVDLYIVNLPRLLSLPDLGLLTSLQSLRIRRCPELKDLPGVHRLTSLESLEIRDCPELTKKYNKIVDDKGNNINPHWNDISHIRNVKLC